jgi:hypothetical protein
MSEEAATARAGVEESIGRRRDGGRAEAGVGVRARSGGGGRDGGRGAHGGGAYRARQATAADAGRQRRAAGPGAQVPGLLRLRRAHRPRRGGALALAQQRHRRHPVLPLRRPQLLAQGSFPSRARKPLPCFLHLFLRPGTPDSCISS